MLDWHEGGIMNVNEIICREANRLPEHLAHEVLDFINYLQFKHTCGDSSVDHLRAAQEQVMDKIWDNSDDDVWNDLPAS